MYKKLLIIICMLLLTSGCWSKKDLNELAIVTAIGIDKTEDGYSVSIQVLNPSELAGNTSSGRTEVARFIKSGETVFEALRKLSTDTPRRVYLAHLREVVFGEELAREGIGKALDFISRDHEMRTDFYITVAKGSTAADILNIQTAIEKVPANKLFNALENSEIVWAAAKTVKLDELINSIVSKGKEPVLTGIYHYGSAEVGSNIENVHNVSPETGLRIDYLAVFKKDKLIGWLNMNESKGFNYITDNIKNTAVTIEQEDGKITIETLRSKTKVKGKMEKGKPVIDITVTPEGNIADVESSIDLSKPENIDKLEKKYADNIKEKVQTSVQKVQEDFQSDIFGFGEVIHRADPKAWKGLEDNWDEHFTNLNVNVHVKTEIRRLGTITDSFQKETKE
ncbi:Ger(x)C family spore germination protein [Metabacillus halosaccharovorans]|uniref:Ger(X)C family spore germination protein n=1 Tax=Metabacillus halosaccharovorans TaxID=930124 RepID=A0ABT3DID0_9BACI|nr:Ger(x)C family spore germination protein [Metabacillus halosaccharovorans]MCV9886757.1 Ger(x)C family spore germination protein [Metabacillus halosaccharovorans]